jgi:uncharacterized membrane protein YfhO
MNFTEQLKLINRNRLASMVITATGMTVFIVLLLFLCLQMAPFGNHSLAVADARIQYLDIFAFFKNVLAGKDSLIYSFSKGLGGSTWVVATYYLFSPFNLLITLFEQQDFHSFYDILVCLKLSFCSGSMAYYLSRRFKESLSRASILLLAVSYGLMQYNLEQSKNIMWLDPLIWLPFLLWEGHQIIQGRSFVRFSLWTAVILISNWYMGFVVILFAGIWLTWEYIFETVDEGFSLKRLLLFERNLFIAILLGVGLAGIILVPTFAVMATGRGGVDWNSLHLNYVGNLWHFFQGFQAGAISGNHRVTLFLGSYALVGTLLCFFSPALSWKKKACIFAWVPFALLVFYWSPLFFLFSLLKSATSYWYRYSFILSIPMIFCAAYCYSLPLKETQYQRKCFAILLSYPAAAILLSFIKPNQSRAFVLLSGFVFVVLLWYFYRRYNNIKSQSSTVLRILASLLVLVELSSNAWNVMKTFQNVETSKYYSYVRGAREQVHTIKAHDKGIYRVHQLHPFKTDPTNITANFNEPLAYGYFGVSSYTSSPDNHGLAFLDRVGYKRRGDNMNITTTSVLTTDSLFGVKYILSPSPINGLSSVSWSVDSNDEKIYYNPYALPLGFVVKSDSFAKPFYKGQYRENPFEYQNQLWTRLAGHPVKVYKQLDFQAAVADAKTALFTIHLQKPFQNILYGNIPTNRDYEGNLLINGRIRQGYSRWLAPSVFYIPSEDSPKVEFKAKRKVADVVSRAQFYYLDIKEWAPSATN